MIAFFLRNGDPDDILPNLCAERSQMPARQCAKMLWIQLNQCAKAN